MRNSRLRGHLNLVIAAIYVLLDRALIAPTPNDPPSPEHGHIIVELAGYPTAIVWHDAGYGELSISVWWKFDVDSYLRSRSARIKPFAATVPITRRTRYPQFVGATASVWLERKEGLFIQGEPPTLFDIYTRKEDVQEISEIPRQEPCRFGISGSYYL
jgi:hypothetical protein